MCEPLFSEWSYGFRRDRSCEMAIRQLLIYLNEGYEWIVDIDLEKFFDNVPKDRLMSLVHDIINDGDTESLIRKYLKAGVMPPQGYEETKLGTPQGGNLSPLLSNVMLNELTCRKMPGRVTDKINRINQVTRGWINYYAIGSMKTAMTEIDAHLRTRIRIIIWKQWKVPKKRQWGLQKLGVGKDLARMTAYCGDYYYWVAAKTCVVRAISKDILAKAGLVSCLDYYIERHALKLC